MEQFLNEQRKQIQQQMEQRMAVQRKIDQQNADKSEVSKVQAKLGNEACEIQNFPFKNMAVEQQPKEHGVVKITNVSPCISHFRLSFFRLFTDIAQAPLRRHPTRDSSVDGTSCWHP
jgi:hypothetical protein